jgi:hypothetical protein
MDIYFSPVADPVEITDRIRFGGNCPWSDGTLSKMTISSSALGVLRSQIAPRLAGSKSRKPSCGNFHGLSRLWVQSQSRFIAASEETTETAQFHFTLGHHVIRYYGEERTHDPISLAHV